MNPESIATLGAEQKLIGSMMVYEGPSLEEIKTVVESDIYYTDGVVSTSVLPHIHCRHCLNDSLTVKHSGTQIES